MPSKAVFSLMSHSIANWRAKLALPMHRQLRGMLSGIVALLEHPARMEENSNEDHAMTRPAMDVGLVCAGLLRCVAQKNPIGPTAGTEKAIRGYHGLEGDSLAIVSTTFMRHSSEPVIAPDTDKNGKPYTDNPHRSFTARSIANVPQRISATR